MTLRRTVLGRSGLEVAVAGLGCGGHSRLGMARGADVAAAARVVSAALDAGVTLIDTAANYGTEEAVGLAIRGRREEVVISTKAPVVPRGASFVGEEIVEPADFTAGVEASLRRLGVDCVDILHLHGVMPSQYPRCRETLVPLLEELRRAGKIRFFGLTERFIHDTRHAMLDMALEDDFWDVVMVGHNMINQSARRAVLPRLADQEIGTLCMFAVRGPLAERAATASIVQRLIAAGEIDPGLVDPDDPLGFLVEEGAAASLIEAAYRFCAHEPGIDVVLTGTGNPVHLQENLAAINGPALPARTLERLRRAFSRVTSDSCNEA